MNNSIDHTQNENNVTSLVEFQLFMIFITNHDAFVYNFKNIKNEFDSETSNEA